MTLHASVRRLAGAVPRDPTAADRPLNDLSRFLIALGVALDSVANRQPLVFTEGQVTRWRERTSGDKRFHVGVERLALESQHLAHEGVGLSSRAHLDSYLARVHTLLDQLEVELSEVAAAQPRAKSVA